MPHLRVDNAIIVDSLSLLARARSLMGKKCALRWGASAEHSVQVRNYAAVDVEVEMKCDCPSHGVLEYAGYGKTWTPESRVLEATDGETTSTTFSGQLQAPANVAGKRTEQLKFGIRRRRQYQKAWSAFREEPLRDIDIS